MESFPCKYYKVANKVIRNIYLEELTLEEGVNKSTRENTAEALVEEVSCEYGEGAKKAISDIYLEELTL